MSTVDELMKGKKPGEIKICLEGEGDPYFVPYFKSEGETSSRDTWHGLNNRGEAMFVYACESNWHLYTDPADIITISKDQFWTAFRFYLEKELSKRKLIMDPDSDALRDILLFEVMSTIWKEFHTGGK